MMEQLTQNNKLLAIIIRHDYSKSGIHFFTPADFSQQFAYMNHPTGRVIPPHVHNSVQREVFYTQEVLFLKRGKLRVDFYDEERKYLESRVLEAGDADKTRFSGISAEDVVVKENE